MNLVTGVRKSGVGMINALVACASRPIILMILLTRKIQVVALLEDILMVKQWVFLFRSSRREQADNPIRRINAFAS